jgi:magnesium-transporting ATPase (P-type)
VRRLDAVETLGSTTFLCTDKTGTLTQNRMAVVEVWTPSGTARISGDGYEPDAEVSTSSPETVPAIREIAIAARRCSTGTASLVEGRWVAVGDPMEAALDVFTRRLGLVIEREERRDPVLRRYPFDPRRRRMSVATRKGIYLKGAPDVVFPVCINATQNAFRAVEDLTTRGLRVLAVARGDAPSPSDDPAVVERDLELLGLIGLEDPPRANAGASVLACRSAGLKVALVTGDHPSTAKAIADEVGLYLPGAPVLAGAELSPDDVVLAAQVDHDGAVFSRVTPEDKLRIARALRSRGHVVAMTGDGVNDGPALREADIGVAMGMSGTDVAREAADLVLLDDDLATVITAIGLGRATFANARRFLTYHLTDNVSELVPFVVWALSGGVIPLALGVLQIIALDLGTDTLSATALGAEPAHRDFGSSKPSTGPLLDRAVAKRAFGVLGPTEALFEMAAFFAVFVASGWRPGEPFPTDTIAAASGAAFATVVLAQTANAFACRSASRSVWRISIGTNWLLVWAAAAELVIAAVFLFVTPIADVLGHANPPGVAWLIAFASVPALLAIDAIHKRLLGRARGAGV